MTAPPSHNPVSQAVRDVAAADPDRLALDLGATSVSYGTLNAQADQLAARILGRLGHGDAQVAVRAAGCHETVVGDLAISRAGKVTVAIDPSMPDARAQAILAHSGAALLIGDPAPSLALIALPPLGPAVPDSHGPVDSERGELVVIRYTSGSTGTPKGVMISREQEDAFLGEVVLRSIAPYSRYGLVSGGSLPGVTVVANATLLAGATVVPYEIRRNPNLSLSAWIESHDVEAMHLVPTVARSLLTDLELGHRLSGLHRMTVVGERMTWEDAAALRARMAEDAEIANALSMSEVGSMASLVVGPESEIGTGPLPAGVPHLLNELSIRGVDGEELPAGEAGEIVVRGRCVALGYWGAPDATRNTFVALPGGRREVRTGDAGRIRPDGMLEHLGRLDDVIKVSGNRVDLADVEAGLRSLPGVTAAAVAAYVDERGGDTRLAACVVAADQEQLDARAIRAGISRRLPGYMIPTRIAITATLPQLPNGKLDRASVAALPSSETVGGGGPPSTPLEAELHAIWSEVLDCARIGRDDSFFAIGGDSLRAAEVSVALHARLGIDRPVSLLAEAPTIASLAAMLSSDSEGWDAPLAIRTEGTEPPLFVVHDGQGSILFAQTLARSLSDDQPVYGIRCPFLDGRDPRYTTFEEYAADQVTAVRRLYPNGPYRFYGMSMGGLIAVEMARQLISGGAEVPLVVLGDSPLPVDDRTRRRARRRRELAQLDAVGQARYLLRIVRAKSRAELRAVRAKLRATSQARRPHATPEVDRQVVRSPVAPADRASTTFQALHQLVGPYRPHPPFPDRVLLLRSATERRSDRGWRPLLGDALQVVDIPGNHREIAQRAGNPEIAALIEQALADAMAVA